MAPPKKTSKPKAPRGASVKRASATLRSMSGAGFEFEDLISAWQLVKALAGEQGAGIDSVITQIQAQVSTLGWRIDDLLLTSQTASTPRRLAISAKGNLQVNASGLPADFVARAWEQWRDPQGPFNRTADGLALVTLGTHQVFDPTWREVKNACNGTDAELAMSRIRSNRRQSIVFNSIQKPGSASDEETIDLIRRLHVLPTDLQLAHSDDKTQAIAQCRRLLASGIDADAQALWKVLINVATEVRLRIGTITIPNLLSSLRGQFDLRHHPDFERDWETLSNITVDHRARIETELPSGYAVPRMKEIASVQAAVADNSVTVIFGESGSGKSALVKSALDDAYPSWNQVWFGPEDLRTALSAARRNALPLAHELSLVLNATVKPRNVLVIDSAERIEASEFVVIRQLLQAILPNDGEVTESVWRVLVVTQTQSWIEGGETILSGRKAHPVEVEILKGDAVKLALLSSPTLGWLAAHDDTITALTNLRTLAWVIQAGAALRSNASGLASHTAIADSIWKHWTKDRIDVQALMMRLAKREASFERSFALTDLESADTVTFTQRPDELPLRLNERTNRIEFEHDLAADWARFQFLKQIQADTPQWAALAGNPLWTNALRMLGQFLLRQPAGIYTAWDVAFAAAEATKNKLAGDILLDALCLDPDAERFLTERVDLLLGSEAKHFTRLLLRFHHIATVPSGRGMGLGSVLGLYLEAQYRSIIFGRWPPVLRFLIAQRERLAGLVSSALAKVIETWLTKTQRTLSNDNLMPFRLEMTEIALAMARTVQVEKGHGVMYQMSETSLYTAPMAGAADLPTEVKNWVLELAGRRDADADVKRRITEVRLGKAKAHAERLTTDTQYKAQHEERKRMPLSLGAFRERLPPWPLGAKHKVDIDFRTACIKDNGIQSLMRAQPQLAAEVLLALIIEDQPEREYGTRQFEMDLGLEYPRDAYPTAFWKSPYFPFLELAPETALTSLIALVNFCTERWRSGIMKEECGEPSEVILQFLDGSKKTFLGWWQVFRWPQSNDSMRNGNLYCALDALERWLTLRIDMDEDITVYIDKILREGNSAALISVLLNLAKYRPSLLKGPLAPLITFPNLFYWDSIRVDQVGLNFIPGSWLQGGQVMFDFARDWTLAPHRKQTFLDVVVKLLLANDDIARHLQALLPIWPLPEERKEALEFKLIFAALNRANYQTTTDPVTGTQTHALVYPEELRLEIQAWQNDNAPTLEYILVPDRCETRLQSGQQLTDVEASYLFNLFQECHAGVEGEDDDAKSKCRLAAAGTLVALGSTWLAQNHKAHKQILEVVRTSVAAVPSTGEEIRGRRVGGLRDELKFVAYAIMHLWLVNGDDVPEWETAVLRLLTSGDTPTTAVVVRVAYTNREQLGSAWWRLLRAGLLWSGLILLAPQYGDDVDRVWKVWLARLRRFPLRGPNSTPDDLDFKRVAAGRGRLDFLRRMRLYSAGDQTWRGKPKRERGGSLDGHLLEVLFSWLINGDGTGDRNLDTRLVLRIWDYDVTRAKAHEKNDYGEYDLPSQNLGYDILMKLGALAVAAPSGEERVVWEPVLAHGPAAHYALKHFIAGLFLRVGKGDDPGAFERVWRATVDYSLAADWNQPGLWFHGERLICDLLGFGNAEALSKLNLGAALRMRDFYKRWAAIHLTRDEECVTRFCYFLTTKFGTPLRLDGLRWLADMLTEREPSSRWYRESTGEALVELVAAAISSDAQALSQHTEARQALVDLAAVLATRNIPAALALQERIKLLR